MFLRGRKLDIVLVFISPSYCKMPKTIRLNATHYFIMKFTNKGELQKIASDHLPDFDLTDFIKCYKDYIRQPY